jgi:hypothetical protein
MVLQLPEVRIAEGLGRSLVGDAYLVGMEASRKQPDPVPVVFVFDLASSLAASLLASYARPAERLAQRTVRNVEIIALALPAAVKLLSAPDYEGDRSVFARISEYLQRAHIGAARQNLVVHGVEAVVCFALSPEKTKELPS